MNMERELEELNWFEKIIAFCLYMLAQFRVASMNDENGPELLKRLKKAFSSEDDGLDGY